MSQLESIDLEWIIDFDFNEARAQVTAHDVCDYFDTHKSPPPKGSRLYGNWKSHRNRGNISPAIKEVYVSRDKELLLDWKSRTIRMIPVVSAIRDYISDIGEPPILMNYDTGSPLRFYKPHRSEFSRGTIDPNLVELYRVNGIKEYLSCSLRGRGGTRVRDLDQICRAWLSGEAHEKIKSLRGKYKVGKLSKRTVAEIDKRGCMDMLDEDRRSAYRQRVNDRAQAKKKNTFRGREILKTLGLTQRQAALRIGVSPSSIARWLSPSDRSNGYLPDDKLAQLEALLKKSGKKRKR